jgi:hypothetical protein
MPLSGADPETPLAPRRPDAVPQSPLPASTSDSARARVSRISAGAIALLVTAWLLHSYYDRFWYPPDEGNYAHVAQRILQGDILNLDVQDVHPGYVSFVNAAALGIFGPDLISLRYPLVVAGLLQAIVLLFVFRHHDPWRAAVATIALAALGVIQFLNPTAHWYCLALVICLIATLGCSPQTTWRLVIAGFLIGTIVLFRQLTGFLVVVGTLTYLLWEAGDHSTSGREALLGRTVAALMLAVLGLYLLLATDVSGVVLFGLWPILLLVRLLTRPQAPTRAVARIGGLLMTGAALAALPLLAYHVLHGSLGAWAEDVGPAAVALTRLDFFERSNFGALVVHAFRQMSAGANAPTVANGLYWAALPLLAAVNGIALIWLLRRSRREALAPLPILAAFYALVSVHFQIPVYLYYTAGLSLASLLWLAPAISVAAGRLAIAAALALASTAVYFHAGQPSSRGIAGVLQGSRIASAGSSSLPHCSLKVDPDEASRYAALVDLIRQRVPSNESIFAVPSNAELYFLSDRRNPFRFFNTALGVRNDVQLAAVRRTIVERPPKLVTFNPADKYNTRLSLEIMDEVRDRYILVGRVEPFEVYLRP